MCPSASNGRYGLDERYGVLSDGCNRAVLRHFRESSTGDATLEELAIVAAARQNGSRTDDATVEAVYLHHVGLPKLAQLGVVDYDPQEKIVRYRGDSPMRGAVRDGPDG